MDDITTLEAIITKTTDLMKGVPDDRLSGQTPCPEFDVRGLLDHLATWIQVFDRAANETELTIDPTTFSVDSGWATLFEQHGRSTIAGLREHGIERDVVMMVDPMPATMILSMMLMEYVGHGWDLTVSTGQPLPFTDAEIAVADAAARAIVQPEHRSPGFFSDEVEVGSGAEAIDRFVAFTGRDPADPLSR